MASEGMQFGRCADSADAEAWIGFEPTYDGFAKRRRNGGCTPFVAVIVARALVFTRWDVPTCEASCGFRCYPGRRTGLVRCVDDTLWFAVARRLDANVAGIRWAVFTPCICAACGRHEEALIYGRYWAVLPPAWLCATDEEGETAYVCSVACARRVDAASRGDDDAPVLLATLARAAAEEREGETRKERAVRLSAGLTYAEQALVDAMAFRRNERAS